MLCTWCCNLFLRSLGLFVNFTSFFVSEPTMLVSGNDFYAFPRVDPTKKRMAWIEWSNPNMSWDKSQLWVGYFDEKR